MLPVSARFLATIPQTKRVITTATLTLPGGAATALTVSSGTVTTDRTQRIRRTATLAVRGGTALFDQLSTPGARITISHGIAWSGTDQELVPMITGELSSAALPLGDGLIQVQVADLWQTIAGTDYLAPYTPATGAFRVVEIANAITSALPGTTVTTTATDAGTIGTAQAWTSRGDMINSLATDGGVDAYFAPDGSFVIRDAPTPSGPISWLIRTGPSGTLKTLTRSRPLGQVFNTVVLEPATADSAQTWTQVVAQITDTSNPLHPNYIGVRPYRYQSPTALTADQAATIAGQVLTKVQGSTETLSLDALSNPALEAGDIVRVLTPIDGGNTIVNHFLDSAATDLVSGAMSCGTRASPGLPS